MKKWFLIPLLTTRALFADITATHDSYDFAFNLSKEVRSDSENWIFSPFSISSCLSMVAAGANGETADEMRSVLALPEDIGSYFEEKMASLKHSAASETDFQLNIAQGVWIKDDFQMLPAYSSLLSGSFQAVAERVAFTPYTAHQINDWVERETNNKIKDLISPSNLNEDTRLVLVNALYFHGSWQHPFRPESTQQGPFHLKTGETVNAMTMHQTSFFPYYENESLQAVALPFSREHGSASEPLCLLVLPKDGGAFDSAAIEAILPSLSNRRVQIQVPKFKIEQAIELNDPLKNLGIKKAFSHSADFSGIDGLRDLCLSVVLHKAFFDFDEKGVEAAAATAAVINVTTSTRPRPIPAIPFIADRPFSLVLLDNKTKTILFLGQVQNPCLN